MARKRGGRFTAIRTLLWALFLSILLAAPEALAATAAELYDRAVEKFGAGEYAEAAKLFHDAYSLEPDPAYLYSEGSAYRRLGDTETAALTYERYLAVVPSGDRVSERAKAVSYVATLRTALGVEKKDRGDCAAALLELEKALAADPGRGAPWMHIAQCREAAGKKADARIAYRSALRDEDLNIDLRALAHERLVALEAGDAAATTADSGALLTPATKPVRKRVPWPLVAAVGGGVATVGIVTAVVIAVVAASRRIDLSDAVLGVERWNL